MEIDAELYKQNPWWEKKFEEKSYERKIYLNEIFKNIKSKEIIFLIGLRRIGKTTIIKQTIQNLLNQKIKPEDIFFMSMDAFNILKYSIHDLIENYRKLHKKSTSDFFYLFLDEVVSKDGFEQELKSLYDNDNIKIICSSSTATTMRDKKVHLTGRTRTIEIMPLTFAEFLQFKEAKILKADKAKIESYFKDYLKIGGIPHYVLTEDRQYLNELIESIIYKDIISYHKISSEKVIKELFILLCQRVGKPTSYNKLAKILKISVDSVKRYVSYFEKAYLFYIVDRYSKSYNEKVTSPKKIYIGDVGIKNLITDFKDLGASFENLVFLKIKAQNPSYYLKDSIEIDFITKKTLVEAKYGQRMNSNQLKLFNSIKLKTKIIAEDYKFFY
jgi:predicted AAA+ superfamily ATPase